jgi:N-acetylated-alpha-linked acidic dipeptidase
LLQHGWHPARTIIIGSWDAEEEGMIGSTEWVEQHSAELEYAVAYFNVDVAVSGPTFSAAAVPSLRQFMREIAAEVPSAAGGTVAQQWRKQEQGSHRDPSAADTSAADDLHVGDLGSGSDYTPFLEHDGIPSADISSDGPFSVYHSVFDNYDWFTRFADPTFAYTQQQARFFGLEILHMADADFLPFNYSAYAQEIRNYLDQARPRSLTHEMKLDFTGALSAADDFAAAAEDAHQRQLTPPKDPVALERELSSTERALLLPQGLPRRPWYRHSIYAPGEFTGYDAVVIPGVNEAIDAGDAPRAQAQLDLLGQALTRATEILNPAKANH